MNFILDKCKVVAITNKTVEFPLPFYDHTYTINGRCLDYESSEKDLGVFITKRLSWNDQCSHLIKKQNNN